MKKKLWAFGKNKMTQHWGAVVGFSAGAIRSQRAAFPSYPFDLPHKEISDAAIFRDDFSFEWMEITLYLHPDTPEMEFIARVADV